MLYIPIIFMACATITSLLLTLKKNLGEVFGGTVEGTAMFTDILQSVIIVPLVVLAIILIIDGGKVLLNKNTPK